MRKRSFLDFVKNLSMGQKLGRVISLMGLPIVLLLGFFIWSTYKESKFVRQELDGVEYLSSMRQLIEAVPQHRADVVAALNGDSTAQTRASQSQSAIDRYFGTLDAANARLGSQFGTVEKVAQLKSTWQEIKTSKLTSREAADTHNRLASDLMDLTRLVGERSRLILDAELDSYYTTDTVVNQIPAISERLNRLGIVLATASARKTGSTPEDKLQAQILAEGVESAVQVVQRNLNSAFSAQNGSTIEPKLNPPLGAAVRAVDAVLRNAREGNLERAGMNDVGAASSAFFTLYDAALPALQTLLENRQREGLRVLAIQLFVSLLIVALATFIAIEISRQITSQIKTINNAFGQIGAGNYEVRLPVESKDELGAMASSMNQVLDNTLTLIQSRDERNRIQQSIQKLLDEISGVATGDLTQEAEVTADVTGAIADSFNYMIGELRQLVSSVNNTTAMVGTSAQEVLSTTDTLAQGSVGQAHQIAEASSAVQNMVDSIRQVSTTAATAADVAEQAALKAKEGSEAVHHTIEGMVGIRNQVQEASKRLKSLGERSQEIGQIVQLIGDVADRTSILALNASIQAAMAGDAGRGFAVVAEEVERLAERATEATKKVNSLIKSIQADTNEAISAMEETTREVVAGSNLVNAAGKTLGEIETVSVQLAELIQTISLTSDEQAKESDELARSMTQISAVTMETAEGAKTAAGNVQQLAQLADELRGSLKRFRLPNEEPALAR